MGLGTTMEDMGSSETVKSELNIFDPLPYQVSHIKGDWIRQEPENNCYGTSHTTPIIIKFDRVPGCYLDFNDSYVDGCVSIEGESTAELPKVAFVNFVLHSLFRDISFSINNTKVEGENQNYCFKSYIFALFNTHESAKQHQMQA